ncbi:glycoside hydrolase family 2 protein [Halopiger xanaduensis]|uniref:Beta-galactosidase n=1 Tax=Halopiger xanaduensis (strain DSM 18323 / JCM 14033 / SH-6) TaxID=797210 RepID=F8DDL5_HALXS|nr:sugar-binding domain-containing protein [Halopiger xanaduensis]AEH39116.1 Beta-galactosidase [Halopiger xanaduensis SH-6]
MNDDTSLRRSRSLDGEWLFEVDPDGIGMTEGWQTELAMWLTEANPVDVPHSWQEDDGLRGYTGTAWYNRTFQVDVAELESRRVFVEFGAADYWTTVWVNGERVGENRGGYLPFEFEITDAITDGENALTVAVHDPEDLSEIPHGKQGEPWFTRVSGIWQSVTLSFRPETHVSGAKVTPDLETDTAAVSLDVDVGDSDPSAVDAVVRASRDGEVEAIAVHPIDGDDDAVLEFDEPAYWSPESPALYDLEITLEANGEVLDRYEDYFGLRTIERDDDGFRLNGDPIRLRGVLDQGYFPTTLYRPPDDGFFERELERVSELGFNLVRKHLKPAHPDFLEAADRQGILVWEEPANPAQYTDRSKEEVKTELRRLVERDYNRPSVVVWSLYHEEWGIGHDEAEETLWTDEAKQTYLASLVETVREWDPTRLVCDNSGWAHVETDLNDYHWYCISPDRATEWVENLEHTLHHRRDNYATQRWSDDGEPVVISEFGALSFPSVSTLVDHYGREPAWFSHEFLTDPVKRPSGVQDRFAETGLDDVFDGLEDLAASWQHRASVSLEHILGEFRTREEIAGYVLTQLYDTEWEVTGLLDYCRNEKAVYDDVAALNADVTIVPTVDSHVAWGGGECELEIALVNDTDDRVVEDLEWEFDGTTETRQLTAPPHSVAELDPVRITAPEVESVQIADLTVRGCSETELARTEPIVVVPSPREPPEALVFAEGTLASRLASVGFDVTHRLTPDVDVAFVTETTAEIVEFVSNGGTAVHVPDRQGEMQGTEFFEFRSLPRTDSWNNAASFFYQDSPLVEAFCSNRHLGWEFEDAYPYDIVADVAPEEDTVHVGFVRGWLADQGSPLLERSVDDGRVVACTFRVQTTAGSHPVVTGLLCRLVDYLAGRD